MRRSSIMRGKDFPLLDADMTVGEALERIRREGVGERVIYFYAVDEQKRLVGVVPTRRLLTAPLGNAVAPDHGAARRGRSCDSNHPRRLRIFVLYKFLAFPVVDEQRRVVGIIDANLFAEEILEAGESEGPTALGSSQSSPEFFEALGFHIEQIRGASPVARFPVPFSVAAGYRDGRHALGDPGRLFEATLARSLVLAFFSHDGAGTERKRQHAIDERDDSCVALRSGHVALAGDGVPSRSDDRAAAGRGVRAGCRRDCLGLAK